MMKKVHSPENEIELAIIKGLLEGEGIPYSVENDYFGSLLPGPLTYKYNKKAVFVTEEYYDHARELITSIIGHDDG